jgi:hypothetical protein
MACIELACNTFFNHRILPLNFSEIFPLILSFLMAPVQSIKATAALQRCNAILDILRFINSVLMAILNAGYGMYY